jgi:hypothetical protein
MREVIDTSELDALARDLATAPARIIPALVPVAHRAGSNIKRAMRKDAEGHRHLPGLPRFVEYDVEVDATSVTVDVGFRKEGAGNLANVAAFGTVNNAPVMDITRGLRDEVPNFMRWVAKVGAEAF